MKVRCFNRNYERFANYGGRGIKVCDRWIASFEDFLADVGSRPSPEHSLDRINNDGNYEPGNVRWATRIQQMNNRSTSHKVKIGDVVLTLAEWARRSHINDNTVTSRLIYGWTEVDAVTVPARKGNYRKGNR